METIGLFINLRAKSGCETIESLIELVKAFSIAQTQITSLRMEIIVSFRRIE